jgi:hypothetical protein
MGVWYCTREDVKNALDIKETARSNSQVDRAIESASRSIEGLMHRKFYPQAGTRYFDWPNNQYSDTWRLWLEENELISVSAFSSGGTTIGSSDYYLEPNSDGPPFTSVEIDLSSSVAFSSGSTHQRSVSITGVFGYTAETTTAGALAEALDDSETGVDITNSALIGTGDIIKVDNEYMIVTNRQALTTTGFLFGSGETASMSDTSIAIDTGTKVNIGEVITVDSERMLVIDITGNNLNVVRGWDGTTLATHANLAVVYAPRTLTVERGALGTTAAAHNTAAAVVKHVVPGGIRSLCIAEAVSTVLQEQAGYARTVGTGDRQMEAAGKGLVTLRKDMKTRYGRLFRKHAV